MTIAKTESPCSPPTKNARSAKTSGVGTPGRPRRWWFVADAPEWVLAKKRMEAA